MVELKYYKDVAFKQDGKLEKWEKDIVISFEKTFDYQFKDYCVSIVRKVDSIMPNININISDISPNVVVLFEDAPGGFMGMEKTINNFKGGIRFSKIYLSPLSSKEHLRFNFCHEFLHTLGLHHAYGFREIKSLMGTREFLNFDEYDSYFSLNFKIPEIDLKAIEIHYNEKISCGMKKEEFIRELNEDCGIQIEE